MHLLEKPIDYSRAEQFSTELNELTLDDAKTLVKKLYEDNRNYKQVAARAAITVEQYKHLLSVFDGYSEDKENMSELGNYLKRTLTGTFDATRNLCFWVKMLCDASKRVVFEDPVIEDIFSLVGNVCCEIYKSSCEFKIPKVLLPDEGICVRNLERAEEENSEKSPRGFYSHQSALINKSQQNTNILQKDDKNSHHEHEKSVVEDEISLDDDARSGEESDNSLKQSASTCEIDCSEGQEKRNEETSENLEKRKEKTFGISYLKSQNSLEHSTIQNKKICSNISAKCDESESSATFDQQTRSDSHIDEDNQSLSENDTTKNADTFSGFISSRSPSKCKRKHSLNSQEGNVVKRGRRKRKISTSQTLGAVAKMPRRYRRSYDSNTLKNEDVVKITDKSETVILQNSISSSKRYQRSNKPKTSDIYRTKLIENSPRKKGKRLKNHDYFSASGTEADADDVISSVKPKRNKRGRRKKLNVTLEHETSKNFKSSNKDESVSFENVPCSFGSRNVIKRAYVELTDVLDDPEAQHYTHVIQFKERLESECPSGVRWKERTEIEETTFNKDRNELEALQEWNVLDAVSDEEDKELDTKEDDELSNNNDDNHPPSDSDVEQEETVSDDDREHLEIDHSDKEFDNSSDVEHEGGCSSKRVDKRNRNTSDNEIKERKKGPSTPPVSPHESELEDNSDVQDENDADADSVKSNEDEDISSRSPSTGAPIYGSNELEAPLAQSDEGEVIAVVDDEDNGSDYPSD